ncbi:xanthine dehydrogenase family protein molybdopterin-binding subunit [Sinorhizobium meliloti]|uniref:xanthine dehydrogenase family protein molybdopterin-binding subunit n=1 Tax=Rhizobium meliloti TaxID=382 RepID=UPI0004F88BAA|nr:xanthine dehydrogenase family protein molybdopterin-binding subunit [Sinorhizobium meliloti]AIM03659.1 dehydrogenase [Sinorhizobium meliloti]
MSVLQKLMETVVQFMPDKAPDPLLHKHGYLGTPVSRVDGQRKVKGEARFAAEFEIENLAYAVPVCSTIAKGRITTIDASDAERSPGVIATVTAQNAPKMKRPPLMDVRHMDKGFAASDLAVLQDGEISWDGQPVAVVVAETLEQAEHAASLVRVEYVEKTARVSFEDLKAEATVPSAVMGEDPELAIGNPEKAFAAAAFKVDNVYRTPHYNHNAIEPHAAIAAWDEDGRLTVFDSTQFVNGCKHALAGIFGLNAENVRVIAPFVGGGFGGKAALWNHTALCAAAAKVANRPVKMALSREEVFRLIGGRTPSEQRVALGADEDGKFAAIIHTGVTATTTHAKFPEQFSLTPRHLYASRTMSVGQKVVNLDTVANTWMRAPGESIGTFALESAIDELAYEMKIDPVELRRLNEPEKDPTKGTEFSSRHLVEAFRRGAEKFGWSGRPAEPCSQRDGKWLIGQGVATAYYPVFRFPAAVRLRISADGSAVVQAAANEMGMGTATVQIQHAADRLGLPLEMVSFRYGDSDLPDSPIIAGGSSQTGSIAAAVQVAVEKAHRELVKLAGNGSPLAGANVEIEARDGGLFVSGEESRGETYASILKRAGRDFIEVEETSGMPFEVMKYSMASYGAQFCEARVNHESGEVRISRWLGSFDCGRILNPKTAVSQLRGGIVMGIGMALAEETLLDTRRGRIMNPSLAEYHVPVHLDVPHIEIIYNDIPDEHTPLGAHGVGEIGITGATAAIANAIFHATGKRIRDLPITLDKLL